MKVEMVAPGPRGMRRRRSSRTRKGALLILSRKLRNRNPKSVQDRALRGLLTRFGDTFTLLLLSLVTLVTLVSCLICPVAPDFFIRLARNHDDHRSPGFASNGPPTPTGDFPWRPSSGGTGCNWHIQQVDWGHLLDGWLIPPRSLEIPAPPSLDPLGLTGVLQNVIQKIVHLRQSSFQVPR